MQASGLPAFKTAQRAADLWLRRSLGGPVGGDARLKWSARAVSGVDSFLIGHADWMVVVGAEDSAGPAYGVALQPFLGEWFIAGRHATWWSCLDKQRRLQTRPKSRITKVSLCIGDGTAHAPAAEREAIVTLASQASLKRSLSTGYALCLLAMGQIDLVVDTELSKEEIAATRPIVEGAGGIISDWGGDVPRSGRVLAAANANVHRWAIGMLGWGTTP
jgi:myo-inositol-1(or 4)-monophosphatase